MPGYSLASADINSIRPNRVGVQTKVVLARCPRVSINTNTNFGNTSYFEIVDESAKQREIRNIIEHQRKVNG